MKNFFYLMFVSLLAGAMNITAQVKIGGNASGPAEAANKSSVLELQSDPVAKKGLLLPRVAITNLNVWGMADAEPQDGMVVYNSTPGNEGAYYWTGGATGQWNAMKAPASVSSSSPGPGNCDGGILAPYGAYSQNSGTAYVPLNRDERPIGLFWGEIEGLFTVIPGSALCVYKRDATKADGGYFGWQEAMDGCQNSALGYIDAADKEKGYSWRLPNLAELAQLQGISDYYGFEGLAYWTSTLSSDTNPWIVGNKTMLLSNVPTVHSDYNVRCVRTVQLDK